MAFRLPNGSRLYIASGYGAVRNLTAFSNANPGVATLEASHGIATGEFFELTSGWSQATGRIFKAGTVATNDVPVLGLNTTDTNRFPAGSGIGSVREISGWTELVDIFDLATEGGEQQFTTVQPLAADAQTDIPTSKSASRLNFRAGDDTSLPWYALVEAANDDRVPRALRLVLPNSNLILYNGYVSLTKTPTLQVNEPMTLRIAIALTGESVRYLS